MDVVVVLLQHSLITVLFKASPIQFTHTVTLSGSLFPYFSFFLPINCRLISIHIYVSGLWKKERSLVCHSFNC